MYELGNDYIATMIIDYQGHKTWWVSKKHYMVAHYIGTQYSYNTDEDMVEMCRSGISVFKYKFEKQ